MCDMLKKMLSLRLAVMILALPMITILAGCGDRGQGPTDPSVNSAHPHPAPADSSAEQFAVFERQATRYQKWISIMDPFVTQDERGFYRFSEAGFLNVLQAEYPEVSANLQGVGGPGSDDAAVVRELRDGIAKANQIQNSSAHEVQGWACWTYWWGRRCCYWGNDAWAIVALASGGSAIPVFGFAFAPFAAWAGYLTQVYGGFCINNSWAGPMWLTRP